MANSFSGGNRQQPTQGPSSILGSMSEGGPVDVGQRIIIYALEKMGKTTLCAGANMSLVIPTEMDPMAMRGRHVRPLSSWAEVVVLCEELRNSAIAGKIPRGSTLVWDSLTALERFIHIAVLKEDPNYVKAYDQETGVLKPNAKAVTMESALGGYGKAYQRANELFTEWTQRMDELARNGGINIVSTCHAFASRVVDPAHGEYDTWDLLLHSPKNSKTYGKREIATQWADLIGFLYEPMFIMKADDNGQLQRGISNNQGRALAVSRAPMWVAGNRYGLNGSIQIPEIGGWNYLADAIVNSTNGAVNLYNRASPPFTQGG